MKIRILSKLRATALLPIILLSIVLGYSTPQHVSKSRKFVGVQQLAAKRIPRSPSTSPPRQRPTRRSVGKAPVRRAPHQYDHTKDNPRPFLDNPADYVASQVPNEGSNILDLTYPGIVADESILCKVPHVRKVSLDSLFPGIGFSETFATSDEFRTELRQAIREDVFDEFYSHISSPKARAMLLLPDSSLQGGWKLKAADRTTTILRQYLGEEAPTGQALMEKIGGLCGPNADDSNTHWMDIVGIPNRKIPYSWHQDRNDGKPHSTVLWGFPKKNVYTGTGVFSHVVKLRNPVKTAKDNALQQPIVYDDLQIDEEHIHRPCYDVMSEIIVYQDANVLHSAPDVTFRTSLMRFMLSC